MIVIQFRLLIENQIFSPDDVASAVLEYIPSSLTFSYNIYAMDDG